ncbi:MAG: tRNA (adenosine(37)-N6)-dimethylallyltransferase MiaA [Clostridia bacterium]|nr:tRNA (adenosine(37)-N6)-dimethylallyltransferase MiaA [Clostridia bacterium]
MKQPIIVITGPTASGKTACAVALARRLDGEIISADSMQVYKGMDLLSAQPTLQERGGVSHHLLGVAEPTERFTASAYRTAAKRAVGEIAVRGKLPIVCGGTGLYIDALTRPMGFSVEADDALHARLMAVAQEPGGARMLHDRLRSVDPESAQRLHPNDIRRVVRAIEVYEISGIPQSEHMRRDALKQGDYAERIFALRWSREVLYARIDARVDDMVQRGLIDEVRSLHMQRERFPTAAQAIGYKEIAAALEGRCDMPSAIDQVKQATRNYAKRQLSWLRRDARTEWVEAEGRTPEAVAEEIAERFAKRKEE